VNKVLNIRRVLRPDGKKLHISCASGLFFLYNIADACLLPEEFFFLPGAFSSCGFRKREKAETAPRQNEKGAFAPKSRRSSAAKAAPGGDRRAFTRVFAVRGGILKKGICKSGIL